MNKSLNLDSEPIEARNYNIKQLLRVRQSRKAISKCLKRGDHAAAGMTIDLWIGTPSDGDGGTKDPIRLELSWFSEELLLKMDESLQKSELSWIQSVKNDHSELQLVLDLLFPSLKDKEKES